MSYVNDFTAEARVSATPTVNYTFSQKWGDDPFTALGHTQVPNALIEYAARLGLAPEECWLIVCLLKFKHTPADPYPSQERLASLVGQSEDTIRRLLKRIERRGLMHVERVRGELGHYTHSVYDFIPLRTALNEAFHQGHPEQRPETPTALTTMQRQVLSETLTGFVYLLSSPHGHYKIGKARHVPTRLSQLSRTLPFPVTLEHVLACDDYTRAERDLHTRFAAQRLYGEWFSLSGEDVNWIKSQKHG